MQLFFMIELALMLLFVVKVGIRNVDHVANRTSLQYVDSSAASRPKPPCRCVDHGWVD